MTESQLKQVIEFAHQAGQRNAGIDASQQAAKDYYQSLVQDGGFYNVIDCKHENEKMHQGDGFVYVTCAD